MKIKVDKIEDNKATIKINLEDERLETFGEGEMHPKYKNVGFTVSKIEGGYKIRWEKGVEEDLDYWKHEILMDNSYPIDPNSPDFAKVNVHNPDDNYWIVMTERPLRAVQVRAVYY